MLKSIKIHLQLNMKLLTLLVEPEARVNLDKQICIFVSLSIARVLVLQLNVHFSVCIRSYVYKLCTSKYIGHIKLSEMILTSLLNHAMCKKLFDKKKTRISYVLRHITFLSLNKYRISYFTPIL